MANSKLIHIPPEIGCNQMCLAQLNSMALYKIFKAQQGVSTNMAIILGIVHQLEFFKHNIPEAGYVSAIRCKGGEVPAQLCPLVSIIGQ
jgi:hypothetical protein